jgi:predicted outer membrane repeat protein
MSAYAPIDDATDNSTGNTYAVLAIDTSAGNYNTATSKGGLILATGVLSMLIALGTLFVYGMKGKDE